MALRLPSLDPSVSSSTTLSLVDSPHVQQALPPLSSPWDYRLECFNQDGNSLGLAPNPQPTLASSS
jgi:hypothetical protein